MRPAMKFQVFPILCLAVLLGVASGLTVERVRLNNRKYIKYGLGASASNSLLECVHQLDEGEEVYGVFWEMWNDTDKLGTYEWRPGSGGNATGSLEGVVKLNRSDGSLELTKLRYDLGGMYSCGVSLTNGETKNTAKEEVLIVDTNGNFHLRNWVHSCSTVSSFVSRAVFPEPTLRAGMFSEKLNNYYEEVSDNSWNKVTHPNGSMTYSFSNVTFKIDQNSPIDIIFLVSMGFTKSNGEYFFYEDARNYAVIWHEVGCPHVEEEDNKEVHYSPWGSATCRGGHKNMTNVTMTCKKGYQAEGDLSVVTMRCNGTSHTWEPEQGQTATIEDFVCVESKVTVTDKPGGGAGRGNPSVVLLSASLLGVVLLFFFNFSQQ